MASEPQREIRFRVRRTHRRRRYSEGFTRRSLAPVVPDFSPTQTDLANAIAQYVYLDQSLTRLNQIQNTDTNLNPAILAYIAAKINEATATRSAAIAYITDLMNNQPPATPPDLSFQFDDPDVVRWRVLQSFQSSCSEAEREIYGNARVTPINRNYASSLSWCMTLNPETVNGQFWYDMEAVCPESVSYTVNLDPVTGIPHRYCDLEFQTGVGPVNTTLQLISRQVSPDSGPK